MLNYQRVNTTFSEVFTFSWPTKKNGVAAYFNVPLFIAKRLATTTVISTLSMQLTQSKGVRYHQQKWEL